MARHVQPVSNRRQGLGFEMGLECRKPDQPDAGLSDEPRPDGADRPQHG